MSFILKCDFNQWLIIRLASTYNFEWPQLKITLNTFIRKLSTNHSLWVKNSIGRISSSLIFGSISNKPFMLSESNIGRSSVKSLVVWNDFHFIILPYTYAWECSSQINTYCNIFLHYILLMIIRFLMSSFNISLIILNLSKFQFFQENFNIIIYSLYNY